MQEKLDAWLKEFEADNGRKPTAQEFQDAKKKITLQIEMARLHDEKNSTGGGAKDKAKTDSDSSASSKSTRQRPKSKRKSKWALIGGAIILLVVIIAVAFYFGRAQGRSSQTATAVSSSTTTKKRPKATKKKTNSASSSSQSSSSSVSSSSDSNRLTKTDLDDSQDLMFSAILYYYYKDHPTSESLSNDSLSAVLDNGIALSGVDAEQAHLNDAGDTYSFNMAGIAGSGLATYFSISGATVKYYEIASSEPVYEMKHTIQTVKLISWVLCNTSIITMALTMFANYRII